MVQLFQKQYFSVNMCAFFMEIFLRFDRSFTVLLEIAVKTKPYSKMRLRWKNNSSVKHFNLSFTTFFTVISFRGNNFKRSQCLNFSLTWVQNQTFLLFVDYGADIHSFRLCRKCLVEQKSGHNEQLSWACSSTCANSQNQLRQWISYYLVNSFQGMLQGKHWSLFEQKELFC